MASMEIIDPGGFFEKKPQGRIPSDQLRDKLDEHLVTVLEKFQSKNPGIPLERRLSALKDIREALRQIPDSDLGKESERLEKEFKEKLEKLTTEEK